MEILICSCAFVNRTRVGGQNNKLIGNVKDLRSLNKEPWILSNQYFCNLDTTYHEKLTAALPCEPSAETPSRKKNFTHFLHTYLPNRHQISSLSVWLPYFDQPKYMVCKDSSFFAGNSSHSCVKCITMSCPLQPPKAVKFSNFPNLFWQIKR